MNEQENVNEMGMDLEISAELPAVKKERVAGGILGAFIGSLIGAVCIILLEQFGYIASISGVVMGICAVKGYQILGKHISTKGIIICTVFMIIMIYFSNWFCYALAVSEVYEADVMSSFIAVPELMGEGAIDAGMYYKDLIMLYLFTALGAVPTLREQLKK